jgi:hypothetical protein
MSPARRKSATSVAFSIAGRLAAAGATAVVDTAAVAATAVVGTAAATVAGAAGRKARLTRSEAGRWILRNA